MRLTVERIEWRGGSTAQGVGRGRDGKRVRFLGDWRAMREIGEAINSRGPIEAEIESWQIVGG